MNVVTLDIESAWDSKDYTLSKMGAIEYSRDPRFYCQMVGLALNGAAPVVHADAGNGEVKAALASLDAQHDMFCAHNGAGFDFVALHENFGFAPRWMIDTIYMMRWCGLSRISAESHAALTELLGNGHKEAGTVVSDGRTWPKDFSPQEQVFFKQYCADDVAQCQRNMMAMMPYMTNDALRFMALTARMATEPVFVLDEAMLDEYIRQLDAEAEDARRRIMEVFHFATLDEFFKAIRSADKFAEMLKSLGVEPPTKASEKKTATAIAKLEAQLALPGSDQATLQQQLAEVREQGIQTYAFSKSDLDFLELREHDDPRVRMLVETRLEFNSSILRSRAETLLKFARHHKPLPIMLSAFKAHTGRYSAGTSEGKSDGTQVQNLSKRNPAHLVLRKAIQAPRGYKIVACDSSQIEARCLAWEAQQIDLLEHFRHGRDPYAELAENFTSDYTAEEIHQQKDTNKECKRLRNLGKLFVLSAGYGVGAAKVSRKLWGDGVRLHTERSQHNEIATSYLQIYRTANQSIVYFWKRCQQVIEALAAGYSGKFGGPDDTTFEYGMMPLAPLQKEAPSIRLPSGYTLRYPNLRAQAGEQKVEYVYDSKLGKNTVAKRIYGGLLAENITQAFAFQILMWQACRMDENGVALKCNIHDSWAAVVPDADVPHTVQVMEQWMRTVPSWAHGCPITTDPASVGTDFTIV